MSDRSPFAPLRGGLGVPAGALNIESIWRNKNQRENQSKEDQDRLKENSTKTKERKLGSFKKINQRKPLPYIRRQESCQQRSQTKPSQQSSRALLPSPSRNMLNPDYPMEILSDYHSKALNLIEFLSQPHNNFTHREQSFIFSAWRLAADDSDSLKEALSTIRATNNSIMSQHRENVDDREADDTSKMTSETENVETDNDLNENQETDEESERSDETERSDDDKEIEINYNKDANYQRDFGTKTDADKYVEDAICKMKLHHEQHEIRHDNAYTSVECTDCGKDKIIQSDKNVQNLKCKCEESYRFPVNGEWSEF